MLSKDAIRIRHKVAACRTRASRAAKVRELAAEYGYTRQHINATCKGTRWPSVGWVAEKGALITSPVGTAVDVHELRKPRRYRDGLEDARRAYHVKLRLQEADALALVREIDTALNTKVVAIESEANGLVTVRKPPYEREQDGLYLFRFHGAYEQASGGKLKAPAEPSTPTILTASGRRLNDLSDLPEGARVQVRFRIKPYDFFKEGT